MLAAAWPGAAVTGLDESEAMLQAARAAHSATAWRSPERQRADPAGNRSPRTERPTGATRAKGGEPLSAGGSARVSALWRPGQAVGKFWGTRPNRRA
ncbi:MAG: hypothetical protein ACRD0Y_07300 [Terriglobales bacterium]